MADSVRLKRMTVALPASLVDKLRVLAGSKRVQSANAAVREAVERYVADLERQDFRRAMGTVASDPEFLRDAQTAEYDFRHADRESAEMIAQW
ncbi:MAG: ribbon-helix-helix protein, CopG family [Firmicutes bacterium]|nr:ribbon-helix-helix protein, CopG family [Bacillota bacterium]